MQILKPITPESIDFLFPHPDDSDAVIEAVEEDGLEYLPNWIITKLQEHKFISL